MFEEEEDIEMYEYPDGYPDELIPDHCFTSFSEPDVNDPDASYYYTQEEENEND
tara:strand:+ start:303 stop:464 length:162 start_codon:yes stop_codon:yes gene_type:complete